MKIVIIQLRTVRGGQSALQLYYFISRNVLSFLRAIFTWKEKEGSASTLNDSLQGEVLSMKKLLSYVCYYGMNAK